MDQFRYDTHEGRQSLSTFELAMPPRTCLSESWCQLFRVTL